MIGVLGAVILAGLVYFVWAHTRPEPKIPAERVVVSFLEAKKTRTLAKVEPYMSKASVEMVRNAFSGRQAQSAGIERSEIENMMLFGRAPSIEELMVSKIEAVRVQDKEIPRNQAVVVAKLTSPARGDEEDEEPSEYGYEFVLVCEKNEWKVDLEETRRRESAGGPKLLQLLAPDRK